MSTSLACTLPYPGEKHFAITSEDCNQAVCYPDTITWTLDYCWWLFSSRRRWFPNKTLFLALFPPSSLSWLSKCVSSCNFISKEEKRPWKLLQIVASYEYFTLPLNSRYWEAISRWNEAISLTPKNEKLYEMKSQVRLRVEEVRGTGAKDGLLST